MTLSSSASTRGRAIQKVAMLSTMSLRVQLPGRQLVPPRFKRSCCIAGTTNSVRDDDRDRKRTDGLVISSRGGGRSTSITPHTPSIRCTKSRQPLRPAPSNAPMALSRPRTCSPLCAAAWLGANRDSVMTLQYHARSKSEHWQVTHTAQRKCSTAMPQRSLNALVGIVDTPGGQCDIPKVSCFRSSANMGERTIALYVATTVLHKHGSSTATLTSASSTFSRP